MGDSAASRNDVTGLFALLAAAPVLLPALGLGLADVAFALPALVLAVTALRCTSAARRAPAHRSTWGCLAVAATLASIASASGVAAGLVGGSGATAFHVGSIASIALLVAVLLLARDTVRRARLDTLIEGLIFNVLVGGVAIYFVVVPGFGDGDPVLTLVFLIDLVAVLVAGIAAIARRGEARERIAWPIAIGAAAAASGDGLVSLAQSGHVGELPALTAVLWTAAGAIIALGADRALEEPRGSGRSEEDLWIYTRLVLPFASIMAIPATGLVLWVTGALHPWSITYLGALFVLVLLLVFGRQAYLLVDNRRAFARERALREEATRRNADLEALTGLASTMTQTLEEAPILERGLGVVHLAAKARSSALHLGDAGHAKPDAVAGDWSNDQHWAEHQTELPEAAEVARRGGREIVRLPLRARGHDIGILTLLRPEDPPFADEELDLLTLLAGQLAVAVQNARDYRERLEQAIRDPLTGVYNRRFFYEALDKEISRSERYGSSASLVLFDLDDFKSINDHHGHTVGDDALRRFAAIVETLVRPVDSVARLGGEEFGLLLPETSQLDALLVAERVRTALARQRILPDRRVTVSGGVSSCPQDATSREQLEKLADGALYWAKRNGKNICAVTSEATATASEDERQDTLAPLYALVSTIDAEPLHTRDHSENVAAYAVALSQKLGLEGDRVVSLRRAAFFHDIGKIAVDRSILAKPGPLGPDEWDWIKLHPGVGASMLMNAGLHEEARWVRQHHEQIDGGGYPDGLVGSQIAFEAKVILVADSFEAMTSDRPYRAGMEVQAAIDELERCSGTQFDPEVVDALVELVARDELAVLALRT